MLTKAEASLSSLAFDWQRIFPPPVSSGAHLAPLCTEKRLRAVSCAQRSLRSSDKQQILAFDT